MALYVNSILQGIKGSPISPVIPSEAPSCTPKMLAVHRYERPGVGDVARRQLRIFPDSSTCALPSLMLNGNKRSID